MSLSAVIVDDEQLARDELAYLLKNAGDIDIVAQGKNGLEAVSLTRTEIDALVYEPVMQSIQNCNKLIRDVIEAPAGPDAVPQEVHWVVASGNAVACPAPVRAPRTEVSTTLVSRLGVRCEVKINCPLTSDPSASRTGRVWSRKCCRFRYRHSATNSSVGLFSACQTSRIVISAIVSAPAV